MAERKESKQEAGEGRGASSESVECSGRPIDVSEPASGLAVLTTASIDFIPLTDSRGILVLIPAVVFEHCRAVGMATLHLDVPIDVSGSRPGWLTVTEAARQHLEDIDGITLGQATAKISRACDARKILAVGHGRERRIDPVSFGAWRLAQRERELDRADEDLH